MGALADQVGGELEAVLGAFVRENRLPGAVAGVVHEDALAWSAGVGFADVAARAPARPGGLHQIASVTKTLTGTAVMQLRDAGKLSLDDPAVAWLPELRGIANPFGPPGAVTVGRMLSHESGLASEPPGTDWLVPLYEGSAARNLRRAAELAVTVRPGSQHKYSDLAYQLLGEIVTRVSGTPYPEYLREKVLDPLGMMRTAFAPLPPELAERRVTGYGWRSFSDDLPVAPQMPPVWAEGGLWSCVADLVRWIACQLAAYREPDPGSPAPAGSTVPANSTVPADSGVPAGPAEAGPQILAAASLREMHRPRYLADDGWAQAWGISWCGTRREQVTWIGHAGGVPGFTSSICFDPVSQVGAVALVNATCGSADLGMELAAVARRAVLAAPPAVRAPEPVPPEFRPLLGAYARPDLGGWVIRLEWRDGRLAFVTAESSWQAGLIPGGAPGTFVVEPGSTQAGDPVVFHRRADGLVTSVYFADNTWVRLAAVPGLA